MGLQRDCETTPGGRTSPTKRVAAAIPRAAARSRSSIWSSGRIRTVKRESREARSAPPGFPSSAALALCSMRSTRRFKSAESDNPW
jgi:hypothetical protein